MASNGLSNRRVVLKRPTVCKSKDRLCGTCSLDVEFEPQSGPANFLFDVHINLNCSVLPADQLFHLTLAGGAVFLVPDPKVTPTGDFTFPAQAPANVGNYLLALIAQNGQNCAYLVEEFIDVF